MYKMYVQGNHGDILWDVHYTNLAEAMNDIAVLAQPGAFGTTGFRICLQVESDPETTETTEPTPSEGKVGGITRMRK